MHIHVQVQFKYVTRASYFSAFYYWCCYCCWFLFWIFFLAIDQWVLMIAIAIFLTKSPSIRPFIHPYVCTLVAATYRHPWSVANIVKLLCPHHCLFLMCAWVCVRYSKVTIVLKQCLLCCALKCRMLFLAVSTKIKQNSRGYSSFRFFYLS